MTEGQLSKSPGEGRYGEASEPFADCSAVSLGARTTGAGHITNVFTHKVVDENSHGHPPASIGPVSRYLQKDTLRICAD